MKMLLYCCKRSENGRKTSYPLIFVWIFIYRIKVLTLINEILDLSKIEAKRFIRAIKRREDDIKKDEYLSEIYKNVDQYLELLKNYRVKIEI